MLRLIVRGILARKLRTALTSVAIVLGVAMVAGTFILTDQINTAFDDIFETGNSKIDAVVSRQTEFDSFEDPSPPMPESVVDAACAGVDGVALAEGQVNAQGQLVVDGEVVSSQGGAPAIVVSNVVPRDQPERARSRAACPRTRARSPSSRTWPTARTCRSARTTSAWRPPSAPSR